MRDIKFVVTSYDNNRDCNCQNCNKKIAEFIDDKMVPSPAECHKEGNVPVPNFGWFCSQDCAGQYEKKYDIRFARTKEGKIDYYADGF